MATGTRTDSQNEIIAVSNLKLGGTLLTASAAEINALASTGLSAAELGVLDGVTAGTAAVSKALVLDANKGITGFRTTSQLTLFTQGAAGTLNATGTLTAALMLGGIVTSTTGSAVTATLDIGTNLETALIALYPGLQNSDAFEFSVINTGGANAFTIATAAGWTDGGGFFTAVAANASATFRVRRTAANTYTGFKIG